MSVEQPISRSARWERNESASPFADLLSSVSAKLFATLRLWTQSCRECALRSLQHRDIATKNARLPATAATSFVGRNVNCQWTIATFYRTARDRIMPWWCNIGSIMELCYICRDTLKSKQKTPSLTTAASDGCTKVETPWKRPKRKAVVALRVFKRKCAAQRQKRKRESRARARAKIRKHRS